MKTTKRTLTALAMVALMAPAMESCKKGEEDPTISMRSRKARVAGEWNVSSMDRSTTETTTYSSGTVSTTASGSNSTTFDGTTLTEQETFTEDGITVTETNKSDYSESYSFDKAGTFTAVTTNSTTEKDVVGYMNDNWEMEYYDRTSVKEIKTDYNGVWNFLSGVGEAKNKEYMNISKKEATVTTTTTETFVKLNTEPSGDWDYVDSANNGTTTYVTKYTYTDNGSVWQLTQLKNDEIKVYADIEDSYTSTSTSGSITSTSSNTEKGTLNITLTAK